MVLMIKKSGQKQSNHRHSQEQAAAWSSNNIAKYQRFSTCGPCVDHWWSTTICLVVREQRLRFILQGYEQTNRPILAIFYDTIFSGRDQETKCASMQGRRPRGDGPPKI